MIGKFLAVEDRLEIAIDEACVGDARIVQAGFGEALFVGVACGDDLLELRLPPWGRAASTSTLGEEIL